MTKKDEAKSLLELMPQPTQEDVNKIAKKVGCSERTVYRALEDLRLTQDSQTDTTIVKKKKTSTKNPKTPQEGPADGGTLTTQFHDLSWKQKLEGAIFGVYKMDTQALTLYDKLGYLKEDEQLEDDRKFTFIEPTEFHEKPHVHSKEV